MEVPDGGSALASCGSSSQRTMQTTIAGARRREEDSRGEKGGWGVGVLRVEGEAALGRFRFIVEPPCWIEIVIEREGIATEG